MPGQTSWLDDDKTIILHEIIGEWRIKDVLDEITQAAELLDTATYQPKYFIFDLRAARGIPGGVLLHREDYNEITDDDSVTVVVGAHQAIKVFTRTMQRIGLSGTPLFADDLVEALVLINRHRENIENRS